MTDRNRTGSFEVNAVIMAGGKSRRMGRDKSRLPVDGVVLIEKIHKQLDGNFARIMVSVGDSCPFDFMDEKNVICDKIAGQGPMVGILSTLEKSDHVVNFVVACDIPEIPLSFVGKMISESHGFDCVIPVNKNGRLETLFGIYKKSMIGPLTEAVNSGKRRIRDVFGQVKVRYIQLEPSVVLKNLNTMDEYQAYLRESRND